MSDAEWAVLRDLLLVLDVVRRSDDTRSLQVLPRRRVVERLFRLVPAQPTPGPCLRAAHRHR
ncbi:hypothetical protein ACWD64_03330 [Streptomyces antibioticus]